MYADKWKESMDNREYAQSIMEEMYKEFYIARDLSHPNVVTYKYFVTEYQQEAKKHVIHIIMEYC